MAVLSNLLLGLIQPEIQNSEFRIQNSGVRSCRSYRMEWLCGFSLGAANPYLCRRFATIRTCFAAVGLFSLNSCNSCNS